MERTNSLCSGVMAIVATNANDGKGGAAKQVGDYDVVTLLAKLQMQSYKFSIPFSFWGDSVDGSPRSPFL